MKNFSMLEHITNRYLSTNENTGVTGIDRVNGSIGEDMSDSGTDLLC